MVMVEINQQRTAKKPIATARVREAAYPRGPESIRPQKFKRQRHGQIAKLRRGTSETLPGDRGSLPLNKGKRFVV